VILFESGVYIDYVGMETRETKSKWGSLIDPAHLKELHKHKYHGIDDSILSYYVLQPYWNTVINYVPRWVAPNVITLAGFLGFLVHFIIALLYSDAQLSVPLPSWLYFSTGIALFIYQTLDALDGKQARRTGSSSPLGELFDHGCDIIASFLSNFMISYMTGYDLPKTFLSFIVGFLAFYCGTLETYYTGVLHLGHINATCEGIFLLSLLFCITGIYGTEIWHADLVLPFFGKVGLDLLSYIMSISMIMLSISFNIRNISKKGKVKRHTRWPIYLHLSIEFIKLTPLLLGSLVWFYYGTVDAWPILFLSLFAIIGSHMTIYLLLSHMLNIPVRFMLSVQLPMFVGGLHSLLRAFRPDLCLWNSDYYFLMISISISTIHYMHSVVCLILQLSEFLNIYCFSLKPRGNSATVEKTLKKPISKSK
jgi:ethanolaminephosphotransferase